MGTPLFSHPEDKKDFSSISLSHGIAFRAEIQDACHEEGVYTFCLGSEAPIHCLSISLSLYQLPQLGPRVPQKQLVVIYSGFNGLIHSYIHSFQGHPQNKGPARSILRPPLGVNQVRVMSSEGRP